MASKETKKAQSKSLQYFSIEEIKEKTSTPEPVFCGVCSAEGWKDGKQVTEDEYNAAVAMFLQCPMGRRGHNGKA